MILTQAIYDVIDAMYSNALDKSNNTGDNMRGYVSDWDTWLFNHLECIDIHWHGANIRW